MQKNINVYSISDIRIEFDTLQNKELKFALIDEVRTFKDKCEANGFTDYLYKADILIADIYLDHSSYEEPLKLLLNDFKKIDYAIYPKIYVEIIERILFIYITKQNYRLALKYATLKEKFIDINDLKQLNRLLLEKSYIYAEMNEADKAIDALKKIIDKPTVETLPYALSNLTKLYIDKKNIILAEEMLNKCLEITDDEEGRIYCDYLLAKICILKENTNEALIILKQIFENEDINAMTLPMVLDYLELLYNLNKFDEMALVISKIALFINASDNLYLQKQFCKNKIRYLLATKTINQLQAIIDEYEKIDKKIVDNEKKVAFEINELDKVEVVNEAVDNMVSNLDSLIAIFNNNTNYSSLRDVFMTFSKSLQNAVQFDSATFVLIDKPVNNDIFPIKDLSLYYYKNQRLYEKTLSISMLEGSVASFVINQNKSLGFDLKKNKLDLVNMFFNRSYIEDQLYYVYAVPCSYQASIFGVLIFASQNNDLTDKNVCTYFDFGAKIFESTLTTFYTNEILDMTKEMYDRTVLTNNIGLVRYNDEDMVLSVSLMNLLKQRSNYINRRTYLYYISRNDYERYIRISNNDNYRISYKLNIGNLFVPVTENIETFTDKLGNKLFKFGTITVDQGNIKTLIDGKGLLVQRLDEIKNLVTDLEYKFAILRFKTIPSDYELIRQTFLSTPYYLSDSDCVLIIENEINLELTIEKLSTISDKFTIIRYPRDVVNIDSLLDISQIMLDNDAKVYDDEKYKDHLKKETASIITSKAINDNSYKADLGVIRYDSFNDDIWIEPVLFLNGDKTNYNKLSMINNKNIRNLLSEENKIKYDIKLFQTVIDNSISVNTLLFLNSKSIMKIIDKLDNNVYKNIYFVISDNSLINTNKDINSLIDRINKYANTIVSSDMLKYISILNFELKNIKGIYLNKVVDIEERERIIKIASTYKLDIISPRKLNDWSKNIYESDWVDIVK